MTVYGYMRVSGEGQVEGDGFFRQKEEIERFCNANGLQITAYIREEGVTGTVEDRPALAALLASKPDVIIVERLDRLARDLMVQELLISRLTSQGTKLYSCDQGGLIDQADGGADPARVMIRQVCGAFAQFEKTATVLKLRKARLRVKAEKGRCEGRKPFGGHPDRPDEKRICQRVLAGKALGLNYRNIQRAVRTEFGRILSLSTIHNILSRYMANGREATMR